MINKNKFVNDAIKSTKAYKELSSFIDSDRKTPILVNGVGNVVRADLIRALCIEKNKKAIVMTADEMQSVKLVKDLTAMGLKAHTYFAKDLVFSKISGKSKEYEFKRLSVLGKLLNNSADVIVSSVQASLQYTIPPEILANYTLNLSVGKNIDLDKVTQQLINMGYERFEQVETTGQFAIRGYIIDIFSPSYSSPFRIELFGNEIDTIAFFDVETQRREETIDNIFITSSCELVAQDKNTIAKKIDELYNQVLNNKIYDSEPELKNKTLSKLLSQKKEIIENTTNDYLDKYVSILYDKPATLFDYINFDEFLMFEVDKTNIGEAIKSLEWQTEADFEIMFNDGDLTQGLDKFSEDGNYFKCIEDKNKPIYLNTFIQSDDKIPNIIMDTKTLSPWTGGLQILYDDIQSLVDNKYSIILLAGIEKFAQTLAQTLKNEGFNATYCENTNLSFKNGIVVTTGNLTSGFAYPEVKVAVITCQNEIKKKKYKKKRDRNSKEIFSLSDLATGDLVVHVSHGIGKFCGIVNMKNGNTQKDYIKIQYAKNDILYVPVTQLDLVSKYIGITDDATVKLDSLSSTAWEKNKNRARTATKDIAKDLIKLYSHRMNAKGFAFAQDNSFQRDFEASFEYEETDDQLRCINEIKDDMEREIPMDRLLCGDVGFGKTEVALRAAFKCVDNSKQCAFLAPTTILAWQHYCTIKRRFEKFPINIELISGFKSEKQKKEIIKKIEKGEVDLVIGTHSLLQDRVKFRDLGLVIIDEEQRFGVAQKEKFKSLKKNVDVLTLSATPIPRTLNMAMSGLRDMSSIEEAPQDRHPVQTYVLEYNNQIVCDAIKRELRRSGQVYFLHNRVETISQVALNLKAMLPDAVIEVAHGRLDDKSLSNIWRRMLENEIDVLVCTTIIETGVDIPNVNTIIINNADRMGLSQLHQLRGRVGRSSRRAYAYFTYRQNKILSDVSEKRLNAIKEFTQFGSGFKIAMRDLQIRGAGNILGSQQHGHMENIGYDLYMKMLNEAISIEKGEKQENTNDTQCTVDLPVDAYIPAKYIKDNNQRLDIYKKISFIRNQDDASDVLDELIDRFGDPPQSLQGLVDVALVRAKAQEKNICDIKYSDGQVLLYQKNLDLEFARSLVTGLDRRVLVNATSKPYISIKIDKDKPLEFLKDLFFKESFI